MNRSAYIAEAYRQLNNTAYYRKLDSPIFRDNIPKINEILNEMKEQGCISDQQFQYLRAKDTDKPRTFYLLPKIHKPKPKWPFPDRMPEGRPIVSDCGSESYRVSQFIDYFVRPVSVCHPSFIKDTYDFVAKIRNQHIPKGAFLVTGDVTSLYTNMNIDRTLDVTRSALQRHPTPGRPDSYILRLLELTMRNNDINFDGQWYLQICGTAMGKNYAPGLADLYLEKFDEEAMHGHTIQPLLFSRFLDDTFFVWLGTEQQLRDFELFLNTIIPGIKITLNWSQESVNFLDVTIYKLHTPTDDELRTKVYFKDTDTHQLLHKTSFHPPHTTKGILKSQLIRFKRLLFTFDDYNSSCKILFQALAKRCYSKRLMRTMKNIIWKTASVDRCKDPSANSNKILPIIVPYNEVGVALSQRWKEILGHDDLFTNFRLITAYTVGSNLKNKLVRSSITTTTSQQPAKTGQSQSPPTTSPGCTPCTSSRCQAGYYVSTGTTFRSSVNHKLFHIRQQITCKTSNVIYLVTCKRCHMQYVGQTTRPLAERINDHLSRIRTHKDTPIGLHFNITGHSINDFSIMGIETFDDSRNILPKLLIKERTWQTLLQTNYPLGINNLKVIHLSG